MLENIESISSAILIFIDLNFGWVGISILTPQPPCILEMALEYGLGCSLESPEATSLLER